MFYKFSNIYLQDDNVKWYSDQLEKWVDGTYHQTTIEKAKGSILTLKP